MRDDLRLLNDIQMDFDEYENIELSELEREIMKQNINKKIKSKKFNYKKLGAIAACVAVAGAVISQTAFAQSIVDGIIKSFSTGHNRFMQMEPVKEREVPDGLKGQVFDKDGNPLEVWGSDAEVYMMDENGNLVSPSEMKNYSYVSEDGTIKVASEWSEESEGKIDDSKTVIEDESQVQQYLSFKMKSLNLDGYEFVKADLYNDENGNPSPDYLMLEYKNTATGKSIFSHQRIINEDTAFEAGTDGDLKEAMVNGNVAVITDNRNIDWEENGASYGISAKGELNADELVKAAESMK